MSGQMFCKAGDVETQGLCESLLEMLSYQFLYPHGKHR